MINAMSDFLNLADKQIAVFGMANRKSVAAHIGQVLTEVGAKVIHVVRSEQRREQIQKLVGDVPILVCDVEHQVQIDRVRDEIAAQHGPIHGLVHSIAFADYSAGWLPFHETPRGAFLQAVDVSCFSFIALANAFRDVIDKEHGSVVTVSARIRRLPSA